MYRAQNLGVKGSDYAVDVWTHDGHPSTWAPAGPRGDRATGRQLLKNLLDSAERMYKLHYSFPEVCPIPAHGGGAGVRSAFISARLASSRSYCWSASSGSTDRS